jgi:hypothetical protein
VRRTLDRLCEERSCRPIPFVHSSGVDFPRAEDRSADLNAPSTRANAGLLLQTPRSF